MRAIEITADGAVREIELDGKDLRAVQAAVGGYFEPVALRFGCLGLVDEDGKRKGKAQIGRAHV